MGAYSSKFHNGKPAVNIKVYRTIDEVKLPLEGETGEFLDPGFTLDWIRTPENLSDDLMEEIQSEAYFREVARIGERGVEIFQDAGYDVEIMQVGRSGGWLEVHGLEDIEDWPQDLVEAFIEFEEVCEEAVNGVSEIIMGDIYYNVYMAVLDEKRKAKEKLDEIWDEITGAFLDMNCNDFDDLEKVREDFQQRCPNLKAKLEEPES